MPYKSPAPEDDPQLEAELELVDDMQTDAVVDDDDEEIEGLVEIGPADEASADDDELPARVQEQLLIDYLAKIPIGRMLCTTAGRGSSRSPRRRAPRRRRSHVIGSTPIPTC
ncbi:MAG: hypothetical protein QM811_17290 [Pirellulales bacterium]